jgi:putative component of toxin-antitoxin plasmid stabilization module
MTATLFLGLLAGGTKKRQQRDIDQARAYWCDYKQRKKGG